MTDQIYDNTDPLEDPLNEPLGYDQSTRTHTVYSEDLDLVGTKPYTVNAFLTDYPSTKTSTPDATAMIQFDYPCFDPNSLTSNI